MIIRPNTGANRRGSGFRGVGGGRAYDPTQEAGALLDWWAEAQLSETGTGVSSWIDGVSGVDVTQGTDANRPTYQATGLGGKPGVRFVAANSDVLTATFANAATSWTAYIFCDVITATNSYLFDSASGRIAQLITGWRHGATENFTTSATGAQVITNVLDASGTTGTTYRGTTSLNSATYSGTAMGGTLAFGRSTGGAAPADVIVGRLLVFTGVHDAATRTRIWNWGASHYGISL